VRYLSAEEILVIHDETMENEGGLLGLHDVGLLFSIVERPKMAMMGQEFYPNVFSKAAVLLEGLATFHAFADGNKRTAFITCATFLGLNGFELIVSQGKAFAFVMSVAVKQRTINQIAVWLKNNSSAC
jgi:death on curing protein